MRKAIFLDRDGVINECLTERVRFVNRPEELFIIEGVPQAIAILRKLGYSIYVVTNQSGVSVGHISESMLKQIHHHMEELIRQAHPQAIIDEVLACIHHPSENCPCRKPKPGMIQQLAKKHQIDLKQSYMVGDRDVDIEAGKRAGCQTHRVTPSSSLYDFARSLQMP